MSTTTQPTNGDYLDSNGEKANLVDLLGGGTPIDSNLYNKKYYSAKNGDIMGSDNRAYNLVDLIKSATDAAGAIKFKVGSWSTAVAKTTISVTYDSSKGYAVSAKDGFKYRFGYSSYSRYYYKIIFDDVEYYSFLDARSFFYEASGKTGAQTSYYIGNLEIVGLSNITYNKYPFLLQAQVPRTDQTTAENVNLLYTNDKKDATHTLEVQYCIPTVELPPMELYRFPNYDKFKYSVSALLFRGSGTDSIMMNLAKLASGVGSLAEGYGTESTSSGSHAEGFGSTAAGFGAHAEGLNGKATNTGSHAEGQQTQASGFASHAEGQRTIASGSYSHAEGSNVSATGSYAHGEGFNSNSSGMASHAEGYYTKANSSYQHVEGKYNEIDTAGKYAHILGGGSSDSSRKNIHTIDWSGNAYYAGDVMAGDVSLQSIDKTLSGGQIKSYEQEATLNAGIYYKFATALDSLSIDLADGINDKLYKFRFGTSSDFTTLTLPDGVIYPDDFKLEGSKTYEIEIRDGFVSYTSWNYEFKKAEFVTIDVGPGVYSLTGVKGSTLDEIIRESATSVDSDETRITYHMQDDYDIYAYNGYISTWGDCYLLESQSITQVIDSDVTFEED